MNIWIIRNGLSLVFKSFLDIPIQKDLVSGLLTALNQFVFSEFKQPIDSINMGGFIWVYDQVEGENLLFVASDEATQKIETLKSRLRFIKEVFLKTFVDQKDWVDWNGNLDMFIPFGETLEGYYYNWQAAENLESFAEFFDFLRVIQEILNLVNNIIKNQIDPNKAKSIQERQEIVYNKFIERIKQLKIEELDNISYAQETGFYIFNIDPTKCDIKIAKKQLISLITETVSTIKLTLGCDLSLNYFNDSSIFQYISKNLLLLKRLDLVDFLFNLFLLP